MAAQLSSGRVNLNVLREAVRRELREFLDKCAGSKAAQTAEGAMQIVEQMTKEKTEPLASLEDPKQTNEKLQNENPTDVSYVYSGYAPLGVRLAQLLSRPGWRSIEEVLRILPGPHSEERQPLPTGLPKKHFRSARRKPSHSDLFPRGCNLC